MKMIKTLLIANRGEIALRVMRSAKEMGIKTVAVYSDADANAPHTKFADAGVHIGGSPVGESYLLIDTIIDAAKKTGADAIHPGYGFLSENADFARACEANDIIFVGPPVGAINVMGDKARSKRAMIAAGVPCVPGYQDEDQSDKALTTAAKSIGFPVMVKAAAGGGGRGMRLVHKAADIENAIKDARSEAVNAFGNGELIIEKAVQKPRHVELQVFADKHGNTVHLGERDCSVQRRHQKVIEEAPCPVMTEKLRAAMGDAAVNAAKAVEYVGAGTVEFLLDASGEFYFLEMNTRLQVEHPVTEMITGLDLVALQLRVAQGEALGLSQDDVTLSGHAMEVRLYAEDPANDFLPSTGPITLWSAPTDLARVDSGIESGGMVSPFYDSMVAKIITHGDTREVARIKLIKALQQTALVGVENNRDFLIDALGQEAFIKGEATTAFIAETYGDDGYARPELSDQDYTVAAVIDFLIAQDTALNASLGVPCELMGWSNARGVESVFVYNDVTVRVESGADDTLIVHIGDSTTAVSVPSRDAPHFTLIMDGEKTKVTAVKSAQGLHVITPARSFTVQNIAGGTASLEDAGGGGTVRAPMHGQLLEVFVKMGDTVKTGQRLAILEAMKMQHEILAEIDGEVVEIAAKAGSQIAADDLIMEIEGDA
ncbi:acetyl-CoA carboxylase biotin carboxylase subunit [Fretibacter rubidus]|uniref:acetyl/propionyl/methylcrotonyl-CoA carboxylase subunit alpha n=1 Tax=Fretibacter rubidus TaxID=570162 RepID=UPI003529F324